MKTTLKEIRDRAADSLAHQNGGKSAFEMMERELVARVDHCNELLGRSREVAPADLALIATALDSEPLGKLRKEKEYDLEAQTSTETLFEKFLINDVAAVSKDDKQWFNQLVVWSKLASWKRANVDLVYQRSPGDLCLIELKFKSNEFAYALCEAISYAIGIEFNRFLARAHHRLDTPCKQIPVLDAHMLTYVVLTPDLYPLSTDRSITGTAVVQKWCGEANSYLADLSHRMSGGEVRLSAEWWRMMNVPEPSLPNVADRTAWVRSLGSLPDVVLSAERSAIRAL